MKVFYDFEFEENGITIVPITLGMVAESGQFLYLQNYNYNINQANDWLQENVINNLASNASPDVSIYPDIVEESAFARKILRFVKSLKADKIELVADYASYDHVALAQRFGRMIDMPNALPWLPYDIKQWEDDLGVTPPEQVTTPHNALNDALYVKDRYEWLVKNYSHPAWSK